MAFILPLPIVQADWRPLYVEARPDTPLRRIGQWTLDVIHDPFVGSTSCWLRAADMTVSRRAVTFQLSRRTDTFEAMYRIDQGPAISWRANAMTLVADGVSIGSEDLINPSGGKVIVPIKVLLGARTISVRPSPMATVRVFQLGDLKPALIAANSAGCGPNFAYNENE